MDDNHKLVDIFSKDFSDYPVLSTELIAQIRTGKEVKDDQFDKIFPPYYHVQSQVHWSSIQVARQISSWITPLEARKFIDIGCGVGKLCLLLRILTDYKIYGIEQRRKLVSIANQVIRTNNFKNISIIQMNMLDLNWDDYDIYYLYNPFQEHIALGNFCILERDIELDQKFYAHYTSEVFRQLTWAKPGKMLITFHGYGGDMPSNWKLIKTKPIENGDLNMWIKES